MAKQEKDMSVIQEIIINAMPAGYEIYLDIVVSEVAKRQTPVGFLTNEEIARRFKELDAKFNACPACGSKLTSIGLCSNFICERSQDLARYAHEHIDVMSVNDSILKYNGISEINVINTRNPAAQVCDSMARAMLYSKDVTQGFNKRTAFSVKSTSSKRSIVYIVSTEWRNAPDELYRYYAVEALMRMSKSESIACIASLSKYFVSISIKSSLQTAIRLDTVKADWAERKQEE